MIQRGNEFQQGKQNHNHPPTAGAAKAAGVMASVKERAVEDQFKPASAIVNEVSLKKFDRFCIEHEVTTCLISIELNYLLELYPQHGNFLNAI